MLPSSDGDPSYDPDEAGGVGYGDEDDEPEYSGGRKRGGGWKAGGDDYEEEEEAEELDSEEAVSLGLYVNLSDVAPGSVLSVY
jgi:hypothetical protein